MARRARNPKIEGDDAAVTRGVEAEAQAAVEAEAQAPQAESTAGTGRGVLARRLGGASAFPLLMLFGFNFFDEFDRLAFDTLAPNIRDAFNLSDAGLGAITIISGVFILLCALPMGYLADRMKRKHLLVVAALMWGSMSIMTGVAWAVAILFIVRLLAGVGRLASDIIHPSLIQDYYKPDVHPQAFQIHRFANPLSGVAGIFAGVIASALSWEWAFFLLAIPTFILVIGVAWMREPTRGESINKNLADRVANTQEPIPFPEARRILYAVKTLRRLWLGAFFLGIGWIPIGTFLSFFFEQVYGFEEVGRGFITFLRNAGIFAGLIVGGYLAKKIMERKTYHHLATVTGLSFVWFAVGLLLMAISPWAALSTVLTFVLSMGIGMFQPAYFSLVGQVSPPRVRSQAYSWAVLFVGTGGIVAIPLFELGDQQGYRWAIAVLAGVVAFAGLMGASAFQFVRRDREQAMKSLDTAVRLQDELEKYGESTLLVCKEVEVAYDSVQVLFGVDMELERGEIVALLGTNGAGKSTLLNAISGIVDPIGGAIYFDGRDITHAEAQQTAKHGIVQVPGGKAVFPTLTVAEHFKAASWLYAKDPEDIARSTEEVLELFPRLRERWDQMAGNLSGGEQQMLALGMAFVAKPKLLMIDELSLGLAPTVVEQLLDIVRAIHRQGATIILVEQSVNVALTVADRAYFMEKGEVRFSGPTDELLERGDILRSVFLAGATKGAGDGKRTDGGNRRAAGAKARSAARAEDREATIEIPEVDERTILEVRGLTKRFGGVTAVDGVDLILERDEILGLIGPNGAGKTTIFDLVSGHLPQDEGRILLKGVDISYWGPDRRAAFGLGRSFQDARIFPSMTVAENIALGLERHIEVRDHLAAALNLPAILGSEEDVSWTVSDLIELMGLGAFRDKFVSELSTGSRRIVDLAMTIAHDPDVLILDEPSSGIAQRETEALGPLLRRIREETGCAMLVIEHDMPLIQTISDEIIALELGRVVVRDTPERVMANPRVVESYLGGDLDVIQRSGKGESEKKRAKARKQGQTQRRKRKR